MSTKPTTFRSHTIAALIGPAGEMATFGESADDTDWGLLADMTMDWTCDAGDIRRANIEVSVPVLGPTGTIKVEATATETD